jgi:bifunctional non-homologous end joining protein LigD
MAASEKLSSYRRKRDFAKTAEPTGEALIVTASRRRFVIQKHAATRLHYDLRLELDGVFKSWAVARGPSLDPADKRLAVEVEDHPLDYGDFEGTIPKGQYGGGTVQLWDRGYWEPEGDRTPEEALASGDFKFVLDGERLHGGWVLVRMKWDRKSGKHTNWLLIKHRDEFARYGDGEVLSEDRSIASGRSMATIAAGKGRSPKPFMLEAKNGAKPDAVWNSNRGVAADARRRVQLPSNSIKGNPTSPQRRLAALPDFRRLSNSAADPGRQSEPEDPEGPRLDSENSRDCRRGGFAGRCNYRW